MTSTILTIVVSLLSITSSHALQPSTTTNCNYALDTWWQTASPPSQSPTPAPTDPPTRSPTPEPTEVNQTTITSTTTDEHDVTHMQTNSGSSIELLLYPYTINQCYSLNFTSEPFNEVAWKYTCTNAYTLKREIWFDSLECTSTASDTIEISENQRGSATQFICSASEPCAYVDISVVPAITQSPTSAPTESPTINSTTYSTTITDIISVVEGDSGDGNPFWQCNNDNGPQPDTDPVFEWKYATNICVNMFDFYGIFLDDDETPENYNGIVYNIGWQCINNNYYMALFNGSDCSQNPIKYMQYSDNTCAFEGSMWFTVACSEDYQPPPPTTTVEVGDDDTGGVKRNGIVIVVAMVLGLVVSK